MRIISISDFRSRVAQEFDRIIDDAEALVVTRVGAEPMVVISKGEYDAWEETAYLLSGRNGEVLRQSLAEMKAADASRARQRRLVAFEPTQWYGVDDLAGHFDLPASTIRELIAAGFLPGTKLGRTWRSYGADILARDAELREQQTDRHRGPYAPAQSPDPAPSR